MKRRYKYKPVEVDVLQWTGKNVKEVITFCRNKAVITGTLGEKFFYLDTTYARIFVRVGDYIVRNGNNYDVVRSYMLNDIFEEVEVD